MAKKKTNESVTETVTEVVKKQSFSIGVSEELYNKIKADAEAEDRPMSRQVARYYNAYHPTSLVIAHVDGAQE